MTIDPEPPALPDDVFPDDPASAEIPPPLDPDAPTVIGAPGAAAPAAAASTAVDQAAAQAAAKAARKTARRETWKLLRRRPEFLIGSFIVLFWTVCAVGGKSIAPHDPIVGDSLWTYAPPGSRGGSYLLGTDRLGRDILSRVIAGARDVLIVAPLAAVLGVALGTLLGLLMGYYRGLVDDLLSRVVEAFLSLPVALVGLLALVVFPPSKPTLIVVVGGLFAPIVARTVRAAVLAERELDYVQAARLQGESSSYIMMREILPNITGPIVVEFTVRIGFAIFTIATLSFLGVGIQPPSPDWGLMITEEYGNIISGFWWPVVFPSLAIASLVVAVNLIADALQGVMER